MINKIRRNGVGYVKKGDGFSHIVYTNLIWLVSVIGYNSYVLMSLFFLPFNIITIGSFLFFNILFITTYIAIGKGFFETGKNLLIITTYGAIITYDNLVGPQVQTYLILFSILPTALNIFHIKKQALLIVLYSLIPFVYCTFLNQYLYYYFASPILSINNIGLMAICVKCIAFILLIIFSCYMVIRSAMKQKKLEFQRVGLQKTLDNLDKAIWSLDKNFNILVINKTFKNYVKKVYKIKIKEGDNIKEIGLWSNLPTEWHIVYNDTILGVEQQQIMLIKKREYAFNATPIFDDHNKIIGATFSSKDITKDNEFERQLIEAKVGAEAASKAKERFLSNMSHEIRTPLNGIIGIVDILKDNACLPLQKDNLQNLSSLSLYTLDLINNILDFAKIEEGKTKLDYKRFHLSELLKKVNAIFKNSSKLKGLHFEIIVNGNADIYIKGDDIRISQVLINLIGNAIKFTEQGFVKLIVDIQENKNEPDYTCNFRVVDSGIGIQKENLGKIFEVFDQAEATTTRRFGGTGLGLSISKKLLHLMQSDLNVESIKDIGSSFYFTLQFNKSSVEPTIDITKVLMSSKDKLKGLSILMAEDNKINQIVARNIIEKWNCTLTIVENGYEAVDLLNTKIFDLILMDLDMPVLDGYEATRILREKNETTPIIALTAASFDNMHFHLTKKGFTSVVQKPFKKEILYAEILSSTGFEQIKLLSL